MITFTQEQVRAFGAARFKTYLSELAARQHERHPNVYSQMDLNDIADAVAPEIETARALGMKTRRDMAQWADLVAVLGPKFQQLGWVSKILKAGHPPNQTLDLIAREAVFARTKD